MHMHSPHGQRRSTSNIIIRGSTTTKSGLDRLGRRVESRRLRAREWLITKPILSGCLPLCSHECSNLSSRCSRLPQTSSEARSRATRGVSLPSPTSSQALLIALKKLVASSSLAKWRCTSRRLVALGCSTSPSRSGHSTCRANWGLVSECPCTALQLQRQKGVNGSMRMGTGNGFTNRLGSHTQRRLWEGRRAAQYPPDIAAINPYGALPHQEEAHRPSHQDSSYQSGRMVTSRLLQRPLLQQTIVARSRVPGLSFPSHSRHVAVMCRRHKRALQASCPTWVCEPS